MGAAPMSKLRAKKKKPRHFVFVEINCQAWAVSVKSHDFAESSAEAGGWHSMIKARGWIYMNVTVTQAQSKHGHECGAGSGNSLVKYS
ncbi:hypothetical protein BGE01nite_08300 [Brevifollis gellanilyticus]|uniref:Uncharacterized protein n=1 Tax=Brevifollis gellanilyticus TaxID=748831 RepID=A0A512M479_9BACT|nr:hypothetical protein BGE01nite_08300 [Brevifollis gellanilyticus]